MRADAKPEADVMKVMSQSMEAFLKRDLDALPALHVRDPDLVVIGTGGDERRIGFAEVEGLFERDFTQFEDASFEFGWHSVSAVGRVAWVAVDLILNLKASGQETSLHARLTNVLEKRVERWLILHEHGSLPAAGQEEGMAFPKKHQKANYGHKHSSC